MRASGKLDQLMADLRQHPGTTASEARYRLGDGFSAGYVSTALIQAVYAGRAVRDRATTSDIWRYTASGGQADAAEEIAMLNDLFKSTSGDHQ